VNTAGYVASKLATFRYLASRRTPLSPPSSEAHRSYLKAPATGYSYGWPATTAVPARADPAVRRAFAVDDHISQMIVLEAQPT
jgi:hypothetical protein